MMQHQQQQQLEQAAEAEAEAWRWQQKRGDRSEADEAGAEAGAEEGSGERPEEGAGAELSPQAAARWSAWDEAAKAAAQTSGLGLAIGQTSHRPALPRPRPQRHA